jgi:hypothetical protein
MCCGSKRSALRNSSAHLRIPTQQRTPATIPENPGNAPSHDPVTAASISGAKLFAYVTLEYLEDAPIRMTGPATGHEYHFSSIQRDHDVDARDATAFTRSGLFRRKSAM